MEKIRYFYNNLFYMFFLTYLLGILSFGRAFAILHIDVGVFTLFITEIILAFSLPFIINNSEIILAIPRVFLLTSLVYLVLTFTHLFIGIINGNFYALRDSVLCTYILFFYISYVLFSVKKIGKTLIFLVIIANLISIFIGQAYVSGLRIVPEQWVSFLMTTRITNLCLYYGITLSFLISYLCFSKSKKIRIFFFFISALNFYVLLFLSSRAAWVASICMVIYFLFMLKMKFVKIFILLLLLLILLGSVLSYCKFEFVPQAQRSSVLAKVQSILPFLKDRITVIGDKESTKVMQKFSNNVKRKAEPVKNTHSSKGEIEEYDNLTFRLLIWKTAFNFGLKSPLWGRGFGVYPNYLNWDNRPMEKPRETFLNSKVIPTHNHLVSLFYKMGLLGLFLFMFINTGIFIYGLRYLKECRNLVNIIILKGALGAIVFWHSMAFFFDIIDSPPTSIFIWILLGLVLACIAVDKNQDKGSLKQGLERL